MHVFNSLFPLPKKHPSLSSLKSQHSTAWPGQQHSSTSQTTTPLYLSSPVLPFHVTLLVITHWSLVHATSRLSLKVPRPPSHHLPTPTTCSTCFHHIFRTTRVHQTCQSRVSATCVHCVCVHVVRTFCTFHCISRSNASVLLTWVVLQGSMHHVLQLRDDTLVPNEQLRILNR